MKDSQVSRPMMPCVKVMVSEEAWLSILRVNYGLIIAILSYYYQIFQPLQIKLQEIKQNYQIES